MFETVKVAMGLVHSWSDCSNYLACPEQDWCLTWVKCLLDISGRSREDQNAQDLVICTVFGEIVCPMRVRGFRLKVCMMGALSTCC